MNKKITSILASLAMMAPVAMTAAGNSYNILDVTFEVDTLFHAKVGPGTTQTSLLFTGPTYDLRVFYLTVDITDPTVSIRAVTGQDMVAGCENTSNMAQRHSKEGQQYFCGVNGDFFATGGTTLRGKSIVGTPTNACIVDGEIIKTSEAWKQFAIDVNGVPYIGQASFTQGTAVAGDKSVRFSGVNVSSPNNAVTVYTPKYYGGTNMQTSSMSEVTVKPADGEKFEAGRSCKMIVTGTPSSAGDMDIPEDGYVLHGRGSANDFVASLKAGDEVVLNSVMTMASSTKVDGNIQNTLETIIPQQLVSGNPRTVGYGETLDTEGERGDASGSHPRTGIGYTADKKKVIMMVVDGRSSISNGARTSQVAEIMRYAGAAEAINLDGGGSSTCYTQALGIRNVPSDGKERSDGNAIFAVSNAPTDNEIAEIRFIDWAMQFPKYGIYTPKFFGFNKYGMLIDTDVKGVKLSCPAELGFVKEDGATFVGNGSGCHALTATYNGATTTIPVTIVDAPDMKIAHDSVINDGYLNYPVEVVSKVGEKEMLLDAAALTWSTSDASTVAIDAETGVLKGVADGTATVTGKLNDFTGDLKVVVEKPTAHAMAIDPNFDPATWTIAHTGGTKVSFEPMANGFKYTYIGKSGRSPYIKFTKNIKLWSLPDTLKLTLNAGETPVKAITFALAAANGVKENLKFDVDQGIENEIKIPTDTWCNTSDISSFPITLEYLYFTMGASTSGKEYSIEIPTLEGIYSNFGTGGVKGNIADKAGFGVVNTSIYQGEPVTVRFSNEGKATLAIYNAAGQRVGSSTIAAEAGVARVSAGLLAQGVYFVSITQNGENRVSKIIVK